MKKLNSFFLMGSVALAGLGVMSSCSSDDLGTDSTNITDNKAVKTQFALNIPRANGGTRMSAQNTQASGKFLGMEDILLYSFSEEPAAGGKSTDQISLDRTLATGDISSSQSSHIYSDVLIPVGTKYFLFYGHGPQGTDAVTNSSNFNKGVLKFTTDNQNTTAVNEIKAKLVLLKGTDTGMATSLITVLNDVANVKGWSSSEDDKTLGKLYNHFINLQAGSANSIRLALESLYNNVGVVIASGSSDEQTIANAIRTAIANVFKTKPRADGYVTLLTYKTSNTYPNNINLPDGAVQVTFDKSTKKFSYAANSSLTGLGTLDASKICFPSSIYYFCSSNLAATAKELQNGQWPTTTNNWQTAAPWVTETTGWTDEVMPTTRSIAMRQNINYGVASLKTTVKCDAASLPDNTSYTDVFNSSDFPGTVAVPTDGFEVTGLLIGGQPTKVGFNFQPESSDAFDYTIYDNALTGIVANNGTPSDANYTIVLPNDKGRTATDQEKVNVAIELKNNSNAAFRGQDGIVPIGGKFYLVGQLDPSTHPITGVTNPAVFMSDYQTTLNLTIKSLEKAYNTIPDLRSTKLQFGMSVDLEWKKGIEFNVNIE